MVAGVPRTTVGSLGVVARLPPSLHGVLVWQLMHEFIIELREVEVAALGDRMPIRGSLVVLWLLDCFGLVENILLVPLLQGGVVILNGLIVGG